MHAHSPIDIHAHFYPEGFLRMLAKEGARCEAGAELAPGKEMTIWAGPVRMGPLPWKFVDVAPRVAEMDETGVDVHALSLTTPMTDFADDGFAFALCEAFNDGCAEAHAKHPDRLVGLATLPWHAPQLAVKELERAAQIRGIAGVYAATKIRDKELADEAHYPIFEAIEGLGLSLFLHPVHVVEPARLREYYLTNLLGNPMESGIAAAHLIFTGVLDRYPKLEICLPHAGGVFPYVAGRLERGRRMRPELKHMQHSALDYLRRFHYDTISHSADALAFLISQVGADRVMLGSDYCFDMGYERPVEVVTGHPGISEADADRILSGNARRLLRMPLRR